MKLPVHVWSDIACPWCWVGKRRLENALSSFDGRDMVELRFHSFELDPSATAPSAEDEPVSQAARLARKYGRTLAQAQEMLDDMTERAAAEGLVMDFARVRSASTFDAHRLLHFAAEHDQQIATKERLMKAYFGEGALVSDHETLVGLAAELGIGGVPFFVIRRYGVSGAQPADVLLSVFDKARKEAA